MGLYIKNYTIVGLNNASAYNIRRRSFYTCIATFEQVVRHMSYTMKMDAYINSWHPRNGRLIYASFFYSKSLIIDESYILWRT